jgi:DNA-binding transcriptional MerR regulator
MKIGQLASTAGLNTSAIRYYEKQGLLQAARNGSNYRVYDDQDLLRLQLIVNSTKAVDGSRTRVSSLGMS